MFFASSFLLLACNGSPSDALTWREQWEIIVITEDGGLIEGVASTGNTGMFRGEGQFRARRLFRKASPIIFEMDGQYFQEEGQRDDERATFYIVPEASVDEGISTIWIII